MEPMRGAKLIGLTCVCMFFVTPLKSTEAAKILLLPAPVKSHVHYVATIVKNLLANGHEVHTVLSPEVKSFHGFFDPSVKIHFYKVQQEEMNPDDPNVYSMTKTFLGYMIKYDIGSMTLFPFSAFYMATVCNNFLGDEALNKELDELKFDLALLDGFPLFRCAYILPYRLGIPYISLVTQYEPWLYGIPALPSAVPFAFALDYTEQMTFFLRVYNFLLFVEWHTIPLVYTMSGTFTTAYAPNMPYKSPNQLAAESKLWFLNADVSIDYARPLLPHVIEVGGLTTAEPKPLPEDLQKFMDDSPEGVILISFGSLATDLPDFVMEAVSGAVEQLKLKVIWKCRSCKIKNSDNINLMAWIPQSALLAHPNTKLFITHGGNNGQFEALYHAVPMLVIPLFGDQMYNANRIQYKGYGIALDTSSITSGAILRAVENIITDVSFKRNILLGSKIYRSRPESPRDRVVWWMEHILESGGDYLISEAVRMPWYQFWMIDIIVFCITILTVSVMLMLTILKFCLRQCGGKHLHSKAD